MVKVIKRLKTIALGLGIISAMALTSCSDDDGPGYSERAMENTELKTILMQQGYTFNEQGALLLDDKVKNTTSLDLSGTGLTDFSGLELFPNLTDLNLSNNGYEYSFDFSKLPAQITGVDLTGNELYEFDGLVDVKVAENGDETVTNLRNIIKLYLPNSAKYNQVQLIPFYRQNLQCIQNGSLEIKMEDEDGILNQFNTLRSIPDENFREYLKGLFSDIFVDNKIDLDKRLSINQKSNSINLSYRTIPNIDDFKNLEGLQYIVENPQWEGGTLQIEMKNNPIDLPTLKVRSNIGTLTLSNLNVAEIDLFAATQLCWIQLSRINNLEKVDISENPIWGQRDQDIEEDAIKGSSIIIYDCPEIKSILLPNKNGLRARNVDIECLDNLETFDLTKFCKICSLSVGNIPETYTLVYPNLTEFESVRGKTDFACSSNTYENPATIDFIYKYYKGTEDKKLSYASLSCSKNKSFRWNRY